MQSKMNLAFKYDPKRYENTEWLPNDPKVSPKLISERIEMSFGSKASDVANMDKGNQLLLPQIKEEREMSIEETKVSQ